MAQPKFRLTISNKNKTERTFKDYKGNERTSKHEGIGAIFYNEEDDRYWIALDKRVTFDPEKHYLNIFANKPKDEDGDDEKPAKKSSSKPKTKVKAKPAKEPEESDDDDDETDPFADD